MLNVKKKKIIQNNFLYYSHNEHPILKLICKHENLQCERKLTRKKVYPLENMQCHSESLYGTTNRQRFLFQLFFYTIWIYISYGRIILFNILE